MENEHQRGVCLCSFIPSRSITSPLPAMTHDNHSQLFAKILKLVNLHKCANRVDVIQSSYHLRIIPVTSHPRRKYMHLLFMAALHSRCGHHIFAVWFLSFFLRLISAAGDWMSTILPHMVWP